MSLRLIRLVKSLANIENFSKKFLMDMRKLPKETLKLYL
jgi:hypothetical protein